VAEKWVLRSASAGALPEEVAKPAAHVSGRDATAKRRRFSAQQLNGTPKAGREAYLMDADSTRTMARFGIGFARQVEKHCWSDEAETSRKCWKFPACSVAIRRGLYDRFRRARHVSIATNRERLWRSAVARWAMTAGNI